MRLRPFALVASCLLAIALSIGCYGTQYKLVDPAHASVDRSFCGDWRVDNADSPNALVTLHVRNLDDHQYVLDWSNEVDGKTDVYTGFVGEVNGVKFVHARPLLPDGSIAEKHLLIRIEVRGDQLTMRQLNEEFMNAQKIDSDDALRKVITDHLESNELYDAHAQSARRIPPSQ